MIQFMDDSSMPFELVRMEGRRRDLRTFPAIWCRSYPSDQPYPDNGWARSVPSACSPLPSSTLSAKGYSMMELLGGVAPSMQVEVFAHSLRAIDRVVALKVRGCRVA